MNLIQRISKLYITRRVSQMSASELGDLINRWYIEGDWSTRHALLIIEDDANARCTLFGNQEQLKRTLTRRALSNVEVMSMFQDIFQEIVKQYKEDQADE